MKREDGSRAEKNMNSDDVSRELISDARNELYLAMRYLFLPLNSLVPKEDRSNYFIATDGSYILYNPVITQQKSMISPVVLNRAYLHTVLHCMFSHPFVRPAGLNEELWDIACDVAVESIIDSLSLKCVMQVMPLQREEAYKKLNDNMTLLDANNVYEYLNSLDRGEQAVWEAAGTFTVDDHKYWYSHNDNENRDNSDDKHDNRDGSNDTDDTDDTGSDDNSDKNSSVQRLTAELCRQMKIRWDKAARQAGSEMEGLIASAGTGMAGIIKALKPGAVNKQSYRDFLRKFASAKEQMHIDMDAFDYGFYNYGLMMYDNMPLIEELEYREELRIEEFVIVIDTSGSCSGRIVQRFLDETFGVLMTEGIFADRTRLHIIQCDNRIQSDTVINNRNDMARFKDNFEVKGFGGTDFRPAFEYVAGLIASKEINNLQGMLYFTDGHGIYPKARPAYKTAFVFPGEDDARPAVPAWAIKVEL